MDTPALLPRRRVHLFAAACAVALCGADWAAPGLPEAPAVPPGPGEPPEDCELELEAEPLHLLQLRHSLSRGNQELLLEGAKVVPEDSHVVSKALPPTSHLKLNGTTAPAAHTKAKALPFTSLLDLDEAPAPRVEPKAKAKLEIQNDASIADYLGAAAQLVPVAPMSDRFPDDFTPRTILSVYPSIRKLLWSVMPALILFTIVFVLVTMHISVRRIPAAPERAPAPEQDSGSPVAEYYIRAATPPPESDGDTPGEESSKHTGRTEVPSGSSSTSSAEVSTTPPSHTPSSSRTSSQADPSDLAAAQNGMATWLAEMRMELRDEVMARVQDAPDYASGGDVASDGLAALKEAEAAPQQQAADLCAAAA